MKKFIVISLMSVMALNMLTNPATTQNMSLQNSSSSQYSNPKENMKENFVKFKANLVEDNTKTSDEKDNNSIKENVDENITDKNIVLNNNVPNYNSTLNNNATNGYGYVGPNTVGYGYNNGFPMNYTPPTLNSYNYPTTYNPANNLNTYGENKDENKNENNNLNTYKEKSQNNNKDFDEKNVNEDLQSNREFYSTLKRVENSTYKENNNIDRYKLNKENNSEKLSLQDENNINNNQNFILQNDAMENKLYDLVVDIKNLCVDNERYNSVSDEFNNIKTQINDKLQTTNSLLDKLSSKNEYKLNDNREAILSSANRINEKLNAIMNNVHNEIGFGHYGLRMRNIENKATNYFELYDSMVSNQGLYNDINGELDTLINNLNEIITTQDSTRTNNNIAKNKNIANENQTNTDNSSNLSSSANNISLKNDNNIENGLKENTTSNLENKNLISNQQNNFDKTISNNETLNNSPKKTTINNDFVSPKPEMKNDIQKNNLTTKDRIENRKEVINQILNETNHNRAQTMKYKNPYEPNNNPLK